MSRERNEEKKGLSPTQRKACVVLALCALAPLCAPAFAAQEAFAPSQSMPELMASALTTVWAISS